MIDRSDADDDDRWWGGVELDDDQLCQWRLGPLTVWLRRRSTEWRLAWTRSDDLEVTSISRSCEPDLEQPQEGVTVERVITDAIDRELRVSPALADRAVVSFPEGKSRVMGGSTAVLYVSTPLWFRLETSGGRVLFEQPAVRPSDTWFGTSTTSGELCYSTRTHLSLNLAELQVHPLRAVTRVRVQNRAHDDFELRRLALPMPSLTLYYDRQRPQLGLWTSSVLLQRSSERDTAHLDIHSQPPRDLEQPVAVAAARSPQHRSVLVRAMNAILG